MTEELLLQVNRPSQYIGREWNVSKKDFDKADIRFALCFPDLYEVGMSNLGIRILYGILNKIEDVTCERFFSPAIDMEKLLRNKNLEIFSLESGKRLREFDMIGFSLGYELNYTNVLNILDLGRIPLESSLRSHSHPLVIGGGPCVSNPEPLHEFFDLFVIGEAEEAIVEIIDIYRRLKNKFKSSKINRQDLLIRLSGIQGVYVPSLYEVTYNSEGKIEEFKPKIQGISSKIKKRFLKELDNAHFPLAWLVPYSQIVHDRISIEIMRGCPNLCRFCQARSHYFPYRLRDVNSIINMACQIYKLTGYEEISLGGLSVSDYPDIEEVTKQLVHLFKDKGVGVSLPSLKPNDIVGKLSLLISTIKKTGLTFAPEAATQRLRNILGKDFDTQDFFKTIEEAYRHGWQHVKLYFMIGLPYEQDNDLDAVLDFANTVSELRKKVNQRPAQVNISINTLIPKPHTAFQWLKMEDPQSIKDKFDYLKRKMKNKRLRLSFHNRYMSFMEGVLSRADRRLSEVIMGAFRRGARFDAWGNYFVFDKWLASFDEAGIDPYFYLKRRNKEDVLPWDFIEVGITKEALLKEFNKVVDIE